MVFSEVRKAINVINNVLPSCHYYRVLFFVCLYSFYKYLFANLPKYHKKTIFKVTINLMKGCEKVRKTKSENTSEPIRKSRPALTPEARENQLISLAVDLAEQQLRDGTASSQVITHYLKLGSTKEKLEKEKIERENELLKAKVDAIQSSQRSEEMYAEALRAMRDYSGNGDADEY